MRKPRSAFALVIALAMTLAAPAAAHQGNPNYRSIVDGVRPPVPGVSVEVLNFDSDMVLRNESDSTILVEGYENEPYLRFHPDGKVEANTRSPAYYLNTERYGDVAVPPEADADATPSWKLVAGTGEYSWHDHRSHYMSTGMPQQVTDPDVRTKVFDYKIPIRVDGKRGAIAGTLYWVGSDSTPIAPFIGLGIGVVILIAVIVVVRRRRAAEDAGERGDDDRGEGGEDGGDGGGTAPAAGEAW